MMRAITVDDERPMLSALTRAVKSSSDVSLVEEFLICSEALAYVQANTVDVAFLDISMRGMGGLALAKKILEIQPQCQIIFCTGYTEYALDAIQMHVAGYLLKPITAEAVQKEIDHIKGVRDSKKLLSVKCFGNFEVYFDNKPVAFKYQKAKEMFAYLVDRKGAMCNVGELIAVLFEEDGHKTYFHSIRRDLIEALTRVGAEKVIVQQWGLLGVAVEHIDCDYYDYLNGKTELRKVYQGEYMTQYSFAEYTNAELYQKANK